MNAKYFIIPFVLIVLVIGVYFAYTSFQGLNNYEKDGENQSAQYLETNQEIDQRYLNNPKFCIREDDCVSYTLCNNENEPRNKFYDNSLTPNYNPDQKCSPDYFAYAGNDVKCENNSCEYRRCYPLFDTSCGPDTEGICAGTYYASECSKTSKEECEVVDVYRASTRNFGNSDGIPDCEWK
jgi:hypothetical protein